MRIFTTTLAIAACLISTIQAEAKPISYVGGAMVMQENDETGQTLSVDYTLTPRYAVGFSAKKQSGDKNTLTVGPQLNVLIKRWNLPAGQGNIFNMTGAGVNSLKGNARPAVWTGFLADYETRSIFTSYEIKLMNAGANEKSVWQRARVGFAPYVGDYDDLHTWLMVQVDNHPSMEKTTVVTPLVRFFYRTTLVEAGYSSNHRAMFNWTLQF